MSAVILMAIGLICFGGGLVMVTLLVVVDRIEQAREEGSMVGWGDTLSWWQDDSQDQEHLCELCGVIPVHHAGDMCDDCTTDAVEQAFYE